MGAAFLLALRVGAAGVSIAIPNGWHAIPQATPPPGMRVGDPVTRIVASSGAIAFGVHGCNIATYDFPTTAVAVVVVEWVRPTPGRLGPRPRRFTAKTLPVLPPPAIECFGGPGGSAQFVDHGRRLAAYVLLGRRAPPVLAAHARAVLDSPRVARR